MGTQHYGLLRPLQYHVNMSCQASHVVPFGLQSTLAVFVQHAATLLLCQTSCHIGSRTDEAFKPVGLRSEKELGRATNGTSAVGKDFRYGDGGLHN